MERKVKECPFCHSQDFRIGYAPIYEQAMALKRSQLLHYVVCGQCGTVIDQYVSHPDRLEPLVDAMSEALLEYVNKHHFILCNQNAKADSLESLGYSMAHAAALINDHCLIYTKAFEKRATYLSLDVYRYYQCCMKKIELNHDERVLYQTLEKHEVLSKEALRQAVSLDKKTLEKALDHLLEMGRVTAFSSYRQSLNWYAYVYCTDEYLLSHVGKLHGTPDCYHVLKEKIGDLKPFRALKKFHINEEG